MIDYLLSVWNLATSFNTWIGLAVAGFLVFGLVKHLGRSITAGILKLLWWVLVKAAPVLVPLTIIGVVLGIIVGGVLTIHHFTKTTWHFEQPVGQDVIITQKLSAFENLHGVVRGHYIKDRRYEIYEVAVKHPSKGYSNEWFREHELRVLTKEESADLAITRIGEKLVQFGK